MFFIKKTELFHGEKYLKISKNYFEGWYFKNTNNKRGISFIPGVSISSHEKNAFIQVVTNDYSYYVRYNIAEFSFSHNPFYIKIGNNYFSKNKLHIDINDNEQNLIVYGDIEYSESININTNFFNPNIMGPFSYLTFMECNHAIINMKNRVDGLITVNDKKICFNNDIGYIEKDWGTSFPKSYIWCQANKFEKVDASFMISIATVPFMSFKLRGIICTLIIGDKEFRFATYNNTKVVKYEVYDDRLDLILKKGKYTLNIKAKTKAYLKLISPVKGKMERDLLESITATVNVILKKNNKIIFSDTAKNGGLEIVNK